MLFWFQSEHKILRDVSCTNNITCFILSPHHTWHLLCQWYEAYLSMLLLKFHHSHLFPHSHPGLMQCSLIKPSNKHIQAEGNITALILEDSTPHNEHMKKLKAKHWETMFFQQEWAIWLKWNDHSGSNYYFKQFITKVIMLSEVLTASIYYSVNHTLYTTLSVFSLREQLCIRLYPAVNWAKTLTHALYIILIFAQISTTSLSGSYMVTILISSSYCQCYKPLKLKTNHVF